MEDSENALGGVPSMTTINATIIYKTSYMSQYLLLFFVLFFCPTATILCQGL